MTKIVRLERTGGADVLEIVDSPVSEPGDDEVRIRVQAIGLNRAEVLFRQGLYLEKPSFPSRIGYEAAGVVEAVGKRVKAFKPGDKVSTIPCFSMSKYGVYGEWAIVPASALALYPDNLSPEEAASIWMQYLTAYGALVEFGKMKAGDFVVVTAASSSVGLAAIELCRESGAIAIATTRGESKKERLLAAGAAHVIVTDKEDLPSRVRDITENHGADIMFDAVAGPMLVQLAKAAAFESTIFEYGALSLETTNFPLMASLERGISVRGYTMFQIAKVPERRERAVNYIHDALRSGRLSPQIDRCFSFSEIAESQRYMESNQQYGKIVVKV